MGEGSQGSCFKTKQDSTLGVSNRGKYRIAHLKRTKARHAAMNEEALNLGDMSGKLNHDGHP